MEIKQFYKTFLFHWLLEETYFIHFWYELKLIYDFCYDEFKFIESCNTGVLFWAAK